MFFRDNNFCYYEYVLMLLVPLLIHPYHVMNYISLHNTYFFSMFDVEFVVSWVLYISIIFVLCSMGLGISNYYRGTGSLHSVSRTVTILLTVHVCRIYKVVNAIIYRWMEYNPLSQFTLQRNVLDEIFFHLIICLFIFHCLVSFTYNIYCKQGFIQKNKRFYEMKGFIMRYVFSRKYKNYVILC